METKISLSPREIVEIAQLYKQISLFEMDLGPSEDPKVRYAAASYLTRCHLPEYKKLPQVLRDAFSIDVKGLEAKANKVLETTKD